MTGYWIHRSSTLLVGADLNVDLHTRIGYGPLRVIFDVGANEGQTWDVFRKSEKKARIICFEPINSTFEILQKRVAFHKHTVMEKLALGHEQGEKTVKLFSTDSVLNSLNDHLMNQDPSAKEEVINIDTIDNYCERNGVDYIDLLKIDTEGYELNVLKGATGMLGRGSIAFLYCEVGILKKTSGIQTLKHLQNGLHLKDTTFLDYINCSHLIGRMEVILEMHCMYIKMFILLEERATR